jgi:RNA recognition motif-containing protein
LEQYKPTEEGNNGEKKKSIKRKLGEDTWEDKSLAEWPENDFRIFVGNLGKEVTDEMLAKTFAHFKSFNKAKVFFFLIFRLLKIIKEEQRVMVLFLYWIRKTCWRVWKKLMGSILVLNLAF